MLHYSHHRYAGNKGDLWKHTILLLLAREIIRSNGSLSFLDSHAGYGRYSLLPGHEWKRGLGELASQSSSLHPYLQQSMAWFRSNNEYRGSFLKILDNFPVTHMTLCDHSEDVVAHLKQGLRDDPRSDKIQIFQDDSFALLSRFKDSHDFTFVDPAYSLMDNKGDDWPKIPAMAKAFFASQKCFAVWYPIYGPKKPAVLVEETGMKGYELLWPLKRQSPFIPRGCGLLLNAQSENLLNPIHSEIESIASALGSTFSVNHNSGKVSTTKN